MRQSGKRSNRRKSLFSPTEAYRGEGTVLLFCRTAGLHKNTKTRTNWRNFSKERKLPYVQGRVWTTDSMLRETVNLVNKRKEEGCIAVEMELAGVQAICDFYGFELYDFLVAGRCADQKGNYETDGLSAANHDLDKLFLALQIAKNMRIEGR
ncbi:MAG: hypothetical protein ACLT1J_04285 [Mediterraneibacter gnavus]